MMKREHSFRLPMLGAWQAVALGILLVLPTAAQSSQALPGTERGEWRYIGGNAGHTRSSPLKPDQRLEFREPRGRVDLERGQLWAS